MLYVIAAAALLFVSYLTLDAVRQWQQSRLAAARARERRLAIQQRSSPGQPIGRR